MEESLPEIRYARSGDVEIAYMVLGAGSVDLVLVMGWLTNLEVYWGEPSYRRFVQRLAGFTRLILFDKRGMGLSDRTTVGTLEERMDDVRAECSPCFLLPSQAWPLCGPLPRRS